MTDEKDDKPKAPPLEGATPMKSKVIPAPVEERKYNLTFLCVNNESVVVENAVAINDLSISISCIGVAAALKPRIVGFRIVDAEKNTVVCECGFLSFLGEISSMVGKAINEQIVEMMHLKKGDKLEDAIKNRLVKEKVKEKVEK